VRAVRRVHVQVQQQRQRRQQQQQPQQQQQQQPQPQKTQPPVQRTQGAAVQKVAEIPGDLDQAIIEDDSAMCLGVLHYESVLSMSPLDAAPLQIVARLLCTFAPCNAVGSIISRNSAGAARPGSEIDVTRFTAQFCICISPLLWLVFAVLLCLQLKPSYVSRCRSPYWCTCWCRSSACARATVCAPVCSCVGLYLGRA
jgi:hypothetical protein